MLNASDEAEFRQRTMQCARWFHDAVLIATEPAEQAGA